ncbi:EamA family transporter [Aliivibrio kagoshimensis]|uniref:EamA family transporter n=1 Tax=Aliivibrio kagoshimensis TaxID=2910230 RepID=UPI003D10D004
MLNNVIPFVLIVWGQTQIASGLASILNAATPIFTVVVAGLFLTDERPTPLKLIGGAVGLIGVVLMVGLHALSGNGRLLAQLAIIAAALSYAFAGLAIISTAIAYVLYFKILELAGATNVLLVTLLVPVSAILLGRLFLNESLGTIHFVGMLMIAIVLSAIDGRLWVHGKSVRG